LEKVRNPRRSEVFSVMEIEKANEEVMYTQEELED
jgi:hypothetical protein